MAGGEKALVGVTGFTVDLAKCQTKESEVMWKMGCQRFENINLAVTYLVQMGQLWWLELWLEWRLVGPRSRLAR